MSNIFNKIVSVFILITAVAVGAYFYGVDRADYTAGAQINNSAAEYESPRFVLEARQDGPEQESTLRDSAQTAQPDKTEEAPSVFSSSAFTRKHWSSPPNLSAEIAVVADLNPRGHSYFKISEDRRWPLASLTKLMTAVVAKKTLHSNEIIRLTDNDFVLGGNAKTANLTSGSAYYVSDIIELALVSSSNAAARSLVRTGGGEEFIGRMNEQARSWGLSDTHFSDAAGVYASNQSTAEEIVTLARKLYIHYLDILQITNSQYVEMTDAVTGEKKRFESTNLFAGQRGFIGGKTGSTPEAKQNLLSVFLYDGEPVVIVVLGSRDRFADTEKLLQWFKHDFVSSN